MTWKTLKETSGMHQGNWRKRTPWIGFLIQQTLTIVPEVTTEGRGKLIALNIHMRKEDLKSIMRFHLKHQKPSRQATFIKLKYKMQVRNPWTYNEKSIGKISESNRWFSEKTKRINKVSPNGQLRREK